jgi:hypothetical protein
MVNFLDKQTIVKGLGLFILVIMALSMLAGAFLMANNGDTSSTDPTVNPDDIFPESNATAFTYNITFDSNVLKELDSARFGAMTSSIDKASIDSTILKIEGVSKVVSQFKKTQVDSNVWVYLAELTFKKGTDKQVVSKNISDLNVFDKSQGSDTMKYITVKTPEYVLLHNADLNIDRNFSFDTANLSTVSALVPLGTMPTDEITVGGQIKVQGKAVLSLELMEIENKTQMAKWEEMMKQIQIDTNAPVDTNTPTEENTATIQIDTN